MAITRVQQTGQSTDNATSVSKAFASNVTAGNLLIIAAMKYSPSDDAFVLGDLSMTAGTATLGTPTLDKSNNYSFEGGLTREAVGIWSVPVTGSGSCTIQVGGGVTGSYWVLGIAERSGLDTGASRVDGTPTSNQGASGAPSPGAITSTGDALFVGAMVTGANSVVTVTPSATYSSIYSEPDGSTHIASAAIDRIVTGAATDNPGWTAPTSAAWAAVGVAYKAAGGGGITGTLGATESGSDVFAATGTQASLGVRLTLRDTDTGALAANLTGLKVAIRSASDAATLLASGTKTTDASGVLEFASGAIGNIGDYVYVTVEKSDNTIVAMYRVQVLDLNA